MGKRSYVIKIEDRLARQIHQVLEAKESGYSTFSEFAEVALENQLTVEMDQDSVSLTQLRQSPTQPSGTVTASKQDMERGSVIPLLARPTKTVSPSTPTTPPSSETLFILTNRFGPLKTATRVLANLSGEGIHPSLKDFQRQAAAAARELGLRLREEDLASQRIGIQRRAVAFPVGKEERAAADRFIFSFTISVGATGAAGPMAVLGLATVTNDRVALTEDGWELALAPSPLIDGIGEKTLSEEEAALLRIRVLAAPAELDAVRRFISAVRRSAGSQRRLDEVLLTMNKEWTADLTIAHRSAMLGRLSELRVLEVAGRGPRAEIALLDPAAEFDAKREKTA